MSKLEINLYWENKEKKPLLDYEEEVLLSNDKAEAEAYIQSDEFKAYLENKYGKDHGPVNVVLTCLEYKEPDWLI